MRKFKARFYRFLCKIVADLRHYAFQKGLDTKGKTSEKWQRIERTTLTNLHKKVAAGFHRNIL